MKKGVTSEDERDSCGSPGCLEVWKGKRVASEHRVGSIILKGSRDGSRVLRTERMFKEGDIRYFGGGMCVNFLERGKTYPAT